MAAVHIQQLLGLRKWIKSPRGFFLEIYVDSLHFLNPINIALNGSTRSPPSRKANFVSWEYFLRIHFMWIFLLLLT